MVASSYYQAWTEGPSFLRCSSTARWREEQGVDSRGIQESFSTKGSVLCQG